MAELRYNVPGRREGAFTLIELLVVVAVLALIFEFLFRAEARPVPHLQLAVGLWLLLTCTLPALAGRLLFAYLIGVVATAGLLSYCMYYRGLDLDGGLRALLGGFCTIPPFYFYEWVRGRKRTTHSPNEKRPGAPDPSR